MAGPGRVGWDRRLRLRRLLSVFLAGAFLVQGATRAHSGHEIVLGEYYYPKGGNAWIPRGTKTEFSPGDYIIVKDSRVTLGRGSITGLIPYILNDATINIDRGTVRLNPAEFVVAEVWGGTIGGVEGSDQWALIAYIDVNRSSISAVFKWYDNDLRGEGGSHSIIEQKVAFNLATIVPVSTTTTSTTSTSTTTATATTTTTSTVMPPTTTTTIPPAITITPQRRRP